MSTLILDATTKTIKAVMSGAASTTNPTFTSHYADNNGTTFTEGSSDGAFNGTTDVTLVSAPSSGYRRTIKDLTIYNADSASVIISIKYDNNGTQRTIAKVTLLAGERWTPEVSFDEYGKIKTQVGTGSGGTPGGSDTQVQFNDGGSFGGDAGLTYNKTTDTLTVGAISVTGNTTLGDATSDTITATARLASDLVPSTNNARDLGTSALAYRSVYAGTSFVEAGYNVVTQTDIGTAPNEIPLNQYLGAMAFIDTTTVALEPGAGITLGTGAICQGTYENNDGVKSVVIVMDLTGLKGGGTAGDIIGSDSTSVNSAKQPAYVAQLPAGFTAMGGRMTCLELPAGGSTSVGIYSATEGTGVQDDAVTGLTETLLIATGTQALGTVGFFAGDPAASSYIYMVSGGTTTTAYTAGRFLVEIFGV